jgi:hypothetical protein
LLSAYYFSIDKVEQYMKGQMYDLAKEEIGDELFDHFEVWSRLKDIDPTAARRYWKDYNLTEYMDIKEEFEPKIDAALINIGLMLPTGEPAEFRDGRVPEEGYRIGTEREEWITSQLLDYIGEDIPELPPAAQPQLQLSQIAQQPGGPELLRLIADGEELPEVAKRRADELGILSYIEQIFEE